MSLYKGSVVSIKITNPFAKGWLLLLLGVIVCSVGLGMQWDTVTFLAGSSSTTGTILRCDVTTIHALGHPTDAYTSVITFQTQTGQTITFEASSNSTCEAGDSVAVRYHPNNPQDARLDSNTWVIFFVI